MAQAIPILSNLPSVEFVRFRMRALDAPDPANGCTDGLPGTTSPRSVFDGFSRTVPLDGTNYTVHLSLGVCDSC